MRKFAEANGPTALYTAQNYLFAVGREKTVEIYDVTVKELPAHVGSVPVPNVEYAIRLLLEYKKNQFIFASSYIGSYLVDISNLSQVAISKVLSIAPMKMQACKEDYFIVASTTRGGIFQFVQDTEMKETSFIDKSLWDFLLFNDTLFCACSEAGFKVFDISRLKKPVLLSQPLGSFFCTSLAPLDKNTAVVKDERGSIYFVDITTPAKPRQLSQIEGALYPYKSFFVSYPYLIVRMKDDDRHMIKVFDCSKPTNPKLVFTYAAPHIVYVTFKSPYFAGWGLQQDVVQSKSSFEIMKIDKEGELQKVKSIAEPVQVYSAILMEEHAYVARDDGIFVMPL